MANNNTPHVLKKTFKLFMQQAFSTPWMRIRCLIALLLMGIDVSSTSCVSYYSKQIVNALPMPWEHALWFSIGLFVLFWMVETTVVHLQDIIFFPIVNQTIRHLTYQTVEHIHRIPFLDYQTLSIPETINCIRRISQSARLFIKTIVLTLLPSFMKIVVAAFVLAHTSLIAIVFIPLIGLIVFLLYKMTQWYALARAHAWQISDQVTLRVNDSLLNTERCRFFKQEEMQHIAQCLDLEAACWQKTNKRLHSLHIAIGILLGLTLGGTLMGTLMAIRNHSFSMGDFVFLQAQLMAALIPLRHFSREFRQIAEALVDIRKIVALLERPVEKNNQLEHDPYYFKNQGINCRKMCFGYEKHIVFNEVSFHLEPGKKVGIIGNNGTGKSTLLKLISGLYQPQTGTIFINGQAIYRYEKDVLHKLIHYIPQHYHLFNNRLRDNLCQGMQNTLSDAHLLAILEKVQLITLLRRLPQGLDTLLGEMGTKLSGGEKQKIALARALLLKPSILLLDETTNALSVEQEQSILETLFQTIPTIILSSHRPSAHLKMDCVFKIHDKNIIPIEASSYA